METFRNLKVGHVLSETSFFKVEKVVGSNVQMLAEDGTSVVVDKGYVDAFLASGDVFSKEEKVTRTEMAEIFIKSARTAMTANFQKQVKEADVAAELEKEVANAYNNSTPSEFGAKLKKAVKESIKRSIQGEERTMRGRHYGNVNEFGRMPFIDMEKTKEAGKSYDTRLSQVDPRTLNWLIVNDIKYIVK